MIWSERDFNLYNLKHEMIFPKSIIKIIIACLFGILYANSNFTNSDIAEHEFGLINNYQRFQKGYAVNWNTQTVFLSRRTNSGTTVVQGLNVNRFGKSDQGFGLDRYQNIRTGGYLFTSLSYFPEHKITPVTDFSIEYYHPIKNGYELSGGIRQMRFRELSVNLGLFSLGYYRGNFYTVYRNVINPEAQFSTAQSLSIRRYGNTELDFLDLMIGKEFINEEINIVADRRWTGDIFMVIRKQVMLGKKLILIIGTGASGSKLLNDRYDVLMGIKYSL